MERQEFEAIVKEVNDAKCCSVYAVEDDCELFAKAKAESIVNGLFVDKHRWYEITTSVYKVGEWFLGVRGVSALFSESMSFSDCEIETIAFEMELVLSETYIAKK